MRYALTEEQDAFQRSVLRFGAEQLRSHYAEDDRAGVMDPSIPKKMAEAGMLGLITPVEYGGQDSGHVAVGLAAEALSRENVNAAYLLLSSTLIGEIISQKANEAQRRDWLPAIASGDAIPTLALTEPGAGSDASHLEVKATRTENGWTISGEKTSISLARMATHMLVLARTGKEGARGISAFYLEAASPGIELIDLDDFGNRAAGRSSIFFDEVVVDQACMIGTEGSGFTSVMNGFDYSRAVIGLMAIGVASAALEDALEYSRHRETFGAPIGTRQGVAFPLVEHLTYLAGARHLCYEALWLRQQEREHVVPSNMAKWWAPKASVAAIHDALLTFGHAGWSRENLQGQRLRDAMGFEIADGTAQIAKLVIARNVLGREFAP